MMAGIEMIGTGTLLMLGGGIAFQSSIGLGVTLGGMIAGITAGTWTAAIGIAVILMGIDLITGNGLDMTQDFIMRFKKDK